MPVYFSKETENAIVEYNSTNDTVLKNQIYSQKIEVAFNKLVENIIHGFKLIPRTENFITLRDKTVGDLVLKIDKFDPERESKFGNKAKAFSFFGTVAKNFIMMEWKKESKNTPLEDFEDHSDMDNRNVKSSLILEKFSITDDAFDKREFKSVIIQFLRKEQSISSSKMQIDEKILDAIEKAFEEDYDITNKKALFLYLREFTGLNTHEISIFLSKFRPKLKSHIKKYLSGEL